MTVISGHQNGQPVDADTYKKDYPQIVKKHKAALKREPTWSMFGGVIHIEDRSYQVA